MNPPSVGASAKEGKRTVRKGACHFFTEARVMLACCFLLAANAAFFLLSSMPNVHLLHPVQRTHSFPCESRSCIVRSKSLAMASRLLRLFITASKLA